MKRAGVGQLAVFMPVYWRTEGVVVKIFLKTIVLAAVMALLTACGSDFEWFPEESVAPIANAGANQSVFVGDTVTLSGNASSDANKDNLTYNWSFTSKPTDSTANLSGATTVSPTFTADKTGDYILSLIVNDGKVNSTADSVTVTVKPFVAVVANAGADMDVELNKLVTLNGRSSTDKRGAADLNGDKLKYAWAFADVDPKPPGAGSVVLFGSDTVNPTFTPTVSGIYKIKLTVNDPTDISSTGSTDEVLVRCNTGSITVTW